MKHFFCAILILSLSACARHPGALERDSTWASKVELSGVENLYRVSPDLYRSEQPSRLGIENFEETGIKTIVSLRVFHSDRSRLKKTALNYERIAFQTWAPAEDEFLRFLKISTDPSKTPVLVHCLHGSDRTGAMCAAYRIVVQDWSKEAAIDEMKRGGYGHHKIWSNLERWIRELNVDALRAKVAPNTFE